MTLLGPNLAALPFANERPVKRATLMIWVAAIVLLAVNIILYQRHLTGQSAQRQALESLEESVETEKAAITEMERQLASLDIEKQNEIVGFLNSEIAKRTFSWSQLFDRLEQILPDEVEVRRISPRVLTGSGPRRAGIESRRGDLVRIELSGTAPAGDELLELVDNLFAHPSFITPNLQNENLRDSGRLEFALDVLYLPATESQQAEAGELSTVEPASTVGTGEGVEP